MSVFERLNSINVNGHTEEREGLTYLSWAWAWAEVEKVYPDANYEVVKQPNGLPYVYDPNLGYMVYTRVTIDGITKEMWLPVLDSKNKAMKAEPYEYETKYGKKKVEAATMFDVNKTIMRCLVKNISMFGLGLYIYTGEDLPEVEQTEVKAEPKKVETDPNYQKITEAMKITLLQAAGEKNINLDVIAKTYGLTNLADMVVSQYMNCMKRLGK